MGRVVVPDLRGKHRDQAKKILRLAGFKVFKEVFVEVKEDFDRVVNQSPAPEEIVSDDTTVTLYVGKRSLIRYLPGIYHPKRPGESNFLHRYLWIFQHFLDELNEKLDNLHELFRPATVPSEFLPWLASWFGLKFGPKLTEKQKRLLIAKAVELFAMRGTAWEIKEMVRLQTGLEIEIEEKPWPYRGIRAGDARIGVDTMVLPGIPDSYSFIVRVPVSYDEIETPVLMTLYEVLNSEKPAHTNYLIQFKDQEGVREEGAGEEFLMQIGVQAIGVEEVK